MTDLHTVRTTMQPDVDLLVGDKELENLRLLGVVLPATAAAPTDVPADELPATPAPPVSVAKERAPRGRGDSAAS